MAETYLQDGSDLQRFTPAIDPRVGGQQGALSNPQQLDSADYRYKNKIIPVLYQAPKAMRFMEDGDIKRQMLKSIIEQHPISIQGLNSTYTIETEETAFGEGGEVVQTPTMVTVTRSEPSMSFRELKGKVITNLFKDMVDNLVIHPQLRRPGVTRQQAYIDAGSPPLKMSDRTFIVLYIEPNETMTGVDRAYLCANMMPTEISDESNSEVGTAGELETLELTFTATTLHNDEVLKLAQQYLDGINRQGYAPSSLKPFIGEIEPALRDDAMPGTGSTYSKYLDKTASDAAADE